jgi:ATP-dependent exoDNAse (exonuclease V) alpha subunit
VEHACGPTGITLVSGRAGTGKTVSADVVVRAMKADGREVIATALSWSAANKLRAETNMDQAYSVAKLLRQLDDGKITLTAKHCVVVDEAGLCDSAATAHLIEHCRRANAKLLMQGDAFQIGPVGAGQAFRLLRDAIGDVELTDIRRQRDPEDLATAQLFYRHAGRARGQTSPKDQRHQIQLATDLDDGIDRVVTEYLHAPEPVTEKLMLATTNAAVRALNQAVREALKESGDIENEHRVAVMRQGRRGELHLGAGDRVRFGRLDEEMAVTNGTLGTVESVHPTAKGTAVLTVRLDEEQRIVKLDTGTYNHLEYGWAMSVDRSQGLTVERTVFLATADRLDVHLGLVAATRSRAGFQMVVVDDLDLIEERLGVERLRVNAMEEGRYVTPAHRVAPSQTP